MVRIWWIFEDLPSSMISASWVEASLGFSEWRETCKSLYLRRIIQILARKKVLEENKRPKMWDPKAIKQLQSWNMFCFQLYRIRKVEKPALGRWNIQSKLQLEHLPVPFCALFRKRERRPILWHYGLSGTLDWWFCQSRFLVLPFPSEVDENPRKSFPSI